MTNMITAFNKEGLYKPSLIDRFNNLVEKLPIPSWIFYVVFAFALLLVQILFLWLETGLQAVELLPVIIFNALAIPFILALIHILDYQAVTALNSMKPVLDLSEQDLIKYEFRISNMPSLPMLVVGLTMTVFFILLERFWIIPVRLAALEQLPVFAVVYQVIDKSSAFLFGVFIYHTIRQLRLVNDIYSKHVQFNLFDSGPLQAFSKLTASTAVGLVMSLYVWMLLNPDLLRDPVSFGFVGLNTILAIAVFVWPLSGVHRLMSMEKEKTLREIDRRFEEVFLEVDQRYFEGDNSAVERLYSTISILEIQRIRISAIPTWPWRPETARFAFTAIALPLILRILQFLAEQTFIK